MTKLERTLIDALSEFLKKPAVKEFGRIELFTLLNLYYESDLKQLTQDQLTTLHNQIASTKEKSDDDANQA